MSVSTLTVREEIAQAADIASLLFAPPVQQVFLEALLVAETYVDRGKLGTAEELKDALLARMIDELTEENE